MSNPALVQNPNVNNDPGEYEAILASFQAALNDAQWESWKKDMDFNIAKTELNELKSKWGAILHYVRRLEDEKKSLEKSKALGPALDAVKLEIEDLKDDLDRSNSKVIWWESKAVEAARRVKELKSINLAQDEKINRLSTPGVITAEFSELNDKYAALQEIFAEKEGELRGLYDKFHTLSQEFQSEKERREELDSLVQKGKDHVRELEENVGVLREELRETISALKEEQKLSETLEFLNQGLNAQLASAQTQLSNSLSTIESHYIQIKDKDARIQGLEDEVTITKINRMKAEERLEATKVHSHELQAKLEGSLAAFDKLTSEVANERQDLQNALIGVRHESLELNGLLKAKLMELERIIGPFEDQLKAYDEESSKWRYFLDENEDFTKQMEKKCSNAIGHQKNQQKIQYLVQLEEALLSTGKAREEIQKEVNRMKKELGDLKRSANRKFSPAKAF